MLRITTASAGKGVAELTAPIVPPPTAKPSGGVGAGLSNILSLSGARPGFLRGLSRNPAPTTVGGDNENIGVVGGDVGTSGVDHPLQNSATRPASSSEGYVIPTAPAFVVGDDEEGEGSTPRAEGTIPPEEDITARSR